MSEPQGGDKTRLDLDPRGFAEAERLGAGAMGNALLMLNLELQQCIALRGEKHRVYLNFVLRRNDETTLPASGWHSLTLPIFRIPSDKLEM